jgi:hypothetical protein
MDHPGLPRLADFSHLREPAGHSPWIGFSAPHWRGTTLRIAWINLPNPGSQVYPMADVLQTADITAGS